MNILVRARRILREIARRMTFVADVAHRAELLVDPAVEAISIDVTHWRIALNASWCESLADDELEFVLAHELFHVLLRTGPRGQGTDAIYWNFAHDMVINQRLEELLGRKAPRGGVTLPADERLSAESVYLRARNREYLDELRTWAGTRWQVDSHEDASVALANARNGHAGASMAGGRGLMSYVGVDRDSSGMCDAGERDVIIETSKLIRPWPSAWLAALSSNGTRARSWQRPSRRGSTSPGRYRVGPGALDVIFDVTPAMLSRAAHFVGQLRAFAHDNQIDELRLLSVDEVGVVADETIDVASWHAVRLPRAIVIQKNSTSKLVDGTWVCGSCERPHAAPRPYDGRAAIERIDSRLRHSALVVLAPRRV